MFNSLHAVSDAWHGFLATLISEKNCTAHNALVTVFNIHYKARSIFLETNEGPLVRSLG